MLQVDLYYSPYCRHCEGMREKLRMLAAQPPGRIAFRERNVLDHIEEAAALGIRSTPALVVDGRLVACGVLEPRRLRALLCPGGSSG
jgi:thioredoxin-like negative regulator of GroEL